ncbi:glycoside hydrolase family 9 protein [Pseudobacteroides cellulosolvens]|uniref:Endoglucanase n=1 Tax=Pseudobacteroides cellulosolvens ATCC 35603 = DSM 2933 TaxID=398512 RepID=A0A0L6JS69_9FIRM|nr:glycoside hydrolase family 9 protein [Pseudobacteroides cellulosolvens]KNY28560.1 Cellulose 1,4-beta-cellobiosidase [Pseudobacteroides cellulosolvens ATCC 35603 = DSM 2933]
MLKKLSVIGLLCTTALAAKMTGNAAEILQTTDFKGGVSLPWHISESNEQNSWSEVKNGEYVVHMEGKGTNKWDVQIRHREMSIQSGHKYTVKFSVKASKATKIYAKIGDMGEPYGEVWNNKWAPYSISAGQTLNVTDTFTADKDYKTAEWAFHLGGELVSSLPVDISFISMSLTDPEFKPTPVPTATPARDIRVNQLGYFPNAAKKATFKVNQGASTTTWQLKNSSGTVVASGTTQPYGPDHASGEELQIIDFSDYTTPGKDYQLVAGSASSFKFDIGDDMYSTMKYDALKYFYHARSGIKIEMPYCVDSKWARAAGHTTDNPKLITGRNYNGPSSIEGSGGWYDAGDHGKYVVNGGISLWTVQNIYEHSLAKGTDDQFADDTMNIPESGNSKSDILDETRWEMEWMLKMQIPSGYDRAGMAVHKMADVAWTALATRPDMDDQDRIYYPPSTAATLNLAACAAQAARMWKDIDSAFSSKCLTAAETAYAAAKKNPAIYAPFGQEPGSGTYGDNYTEDDFYWAACELYVTTGDSEYLSDIKGYKNAFQMPVTLSGESNGMAGCFDWGATGGLGTLTLALHKSEEFPEVGESIKKAADTFIGVQAQEGYGIPLEESTYINEFAGQSEEITGYPWASNAFVINEAIVMAYAYDVSGDSKYFNGVTESMDYLMGRNPMLQNYVTGYGENPLKYPHHRFFCPQIDASFPSAPPGFLSGGPNSGCQDPWASGAGLKVNKAPAQKCFLDHVESWSTNEVTINWNAPLAWITYFLDSYNDIDPSTPPKNTPTPTSYTGGKVPEDVNRDGVVNMVDVMRIATAFGTVSGNVKFEPACDLNSDGAVNMADVMKLAVKFGYTYSL